MPLSADGKTLQVNGVGQLDELMTIPTTVTMVEIHRTGNIDVYLTVLPSHVKSLRLVEVSVDRAVALAEGLEHLLMVEVSLGVSFAEWTFPSTLDKVTLEDIYFEVLDLRSAPASRISLVRLGYLGQRIFLPDTLRSLNIANDSNLNDLRVTFPEVIPGRFDPKDYWTPALKDYDDEYNQGLDSQDYNETKVLLLPPTLEVLTLTIISEVLAFGPSQTTQVTRLVIENPRRKTDIGALFPNLETLEFLHVSIKPSPPMFLPKLKHLVLRRPFTIEHIDFNSPVLESLVVVYNGRGDKTFVSNDLGSSLKTMVLDGVPVFPHSEDWQRLESVTIANVNATKVPANLPEAIFREFQGMDLPFIPWLQELTIDEPMRARGHIVCDLTEYRLAWGISRKKKAVA